MFFRKLIVKIFIDFNKYIRKLKFIYFQKIKFNIKKYYTIKIIKS